MAFLSDASSFDPAAAYEHAQQDFVHGNLEAAQSEAEWGYEWSRHSDPHWSGRFQLLAANAMLWRSSYDDLLQLLADQSKSAFDLYAGDRGEKVNGIALEIQALVHLARFSEAASKLKQADALCSSIRIPECGSVSLAHGLLDVSLDNLDEAKISLLQTVDVARKSHNSFLEATALLDIGTVLTGQENYDEAITLYQSSNQVAQGIGARALAQSALSGQGLAYDRMGNPERALDLYAAAEASARSMKDVVGEIYLLICLANLHSELRQFDSAESSDIEAIRLAKVFHHRDYIINASEDLAQIYVDEARQDDADRVAGEALALTQQPGNKADVLYCHMLQGEAAALRHNWLRAEALLREVATAPESQKRMRWIAEHTLATGYEAQGQMIAAEQAYKAAIAFVEAARGDTHQELSQLTFLNNAARIYDDYIHFLVSQGRTDEALDAADWSRARTLQQGLGIISASASVEPPSLHARAIALTTNTTLLFYWMGGRESYLWAVTSEKTMFIALPAKNEIVTRVQRYRRTLLSLKDPLRANGGQGDKDGRELYEMLVAPVSGVVSTSRPVVLFTDGAMTQLNFETLLAGASTPHYWIEDATVSSSPSIRLFATRNKTVGAAQDKLLLMGDSVSADHTFINLPLAGLEVKKVGDNFRPSDAVIFSGARATPLTYLASRPEQFTYIHFVAHATADTTDPLESAVILSRDGTGGDSYKLYAREILKHPISARLVTISSCNSSGETFYAGEGTVGLSWAFLRAGAHNTIGALWEVSDASTPNLMDHLYAGLVQKEPPATALRNAKLALVHSSGSFNRPFYWAPFQLYSGH